MNQDVKGLGLDARNGGTHWDLNIPGRLVLRGYDGLGLMDFARLFQRAPKQRGVTDLGYSQAARYISLQWAMYARTQPEYRNLRDHLMGAFYPREFDAIRLTFNWDSSRVRAVDVNLEGSLDFTSGARVKSSGIVSALVKAADPRLYDPTQITATFSPVTGNTGWLIDWPIPWFLAEGNVNGTVTINYANGDRTAAPEYPVLRVQGPIEDPIITNTTTNEKVELTGLLIGAGSYATVDLAGGPFRDASPNIRDNTGASVEQYLSSDSDLSTWHLAPAGELLFDGARCDGNNVIRLQGTGGTSATRLDVIYYNRYVGA